jgi:hypothetical protein
MIVGKDISILMEDKTGALPHLALLLGLTPWHSRPEKPSEKGVIEKTQGVVTHQGAAPSDCLFNLDKYNSAVGLFCNRGKGLAGSLKQPDVIVNGCRGAGNQNSHQDNRGNHPAQNNSCSVRKM